MNILVANPAKNITVFVLDPVDDSTERISMARSILAAPGIGAEQVGFVFPPDKAGSFKPAAEHGLWHLEMAGGEFCGNAARCFGLYVARKQGLEGSGEVSVSVSGTEKPVRVEVDMTRGTAAAEIQPPEVATPLEFQRHSLPTFVFETMIHVIAPNYGAYDDTFYSIKKLVEDKFSFPGKPLPSAIGVLFYDMRTGLMRPAVYVRSTDTLLFESSCGSGSAALAVWLSACLWDGVAWHTLLQPGGEIRTKVYKEKGEITRITVGGKVILGEPEEFNAPTPEKA